MPGQDDETCHYPRCHDLHSNVGGAGHDFCNEGPAAPITYQQHGEAEERRMARSETVKLRVERLLQAFGLCRRSLRQQVQVLHARHATVQPTRYTASRSRITVLGKVKLR